MLASEAVGFAVAGDDVGRVAVCNFLKLCGDLSGCRNHFISLLIRPIPWLPLEVGKAEILTLPDSLTHAALSDFLGPMNLTFGGENEAVPVAAIAESPGLGGLIFDF